MENGFFLRASTLVVKDEEKCCIDAVYCIVSPRYGVLLGLLQIRSAPELNECVSQIRVNVKKKKRSDFKLLILQCPIFSKISLEFGGIFSFSY